MNDFAEGYRDGRDPNSPCPGENRSFAYRHSFEVARRERDGTHWSADEARRRAAIAESKDAAAFA